MNGAEGEMEKEGIRVQSGRGGVPLQGSVGCIWQCHIHCGDRTNSNHQKRAHISISHLKTNATTRSKVCLASQITNRTLS